MSRMPSLLVDSHCHLDYFERDGDLDDVLERARQAGIGGLLTIGTKIKTFPAIHAIARARRNVWCTIGTHPHEAADESVTRIDDLVALAQDPRVVGIGETGLDYYYDHSPREIQQAVFRTHIAAAQAADLPLVIHTRDAEADTETLLREAQSQGPLAGVLHCFSSGPDLARVALDLGLMIGISGIVTFKKSDTLRDILRSVPLERLLVETDAPYLAPMPHRGKRNEPSYMVRTAALVAEVKGVSYEEVIARTTKTFFSVFSKADPAELEHPLGELVAAA